MHTFCCSFVNLIFQVCASFMTSNTEILTYQLTFIILIFPLLTFSTPLKKSNLFFSQINQGKKDYFPSVFLKNAALACYNSSK